MQSDETVVVAILALSAFELAEPFADLDGLSFTFDDFLAVGAVDTALVEVFEELPEFLVEAELPLGELEFAGPPCVFSEFDEVAGLDGFEPVLLCD